MKKSSLSRRDFLTRAGALAAVASVPTIAAAAVTNKTEPVKAPEEAAPEKAAAAGVPKRQLGKTDLMLPVLSCGTGVGQAPNILNYAISKGVNFLHTSTGYARGRSIKNVGEAIKDKRDQVIVGLKITWEPDDLTRMDAALADLGIETADIAFFNIHNAEQVKQPKYEKAAEMLKKEGKCRYIGLTTHGDMKNCMDVALEQGFYDALMPSYNLSMADECAETFAKAAEKKVGVVLMKTQKGLDDEAYFAAMSTYLDTPGITTLLRTLSSFQQINNMIGALEPSSEEERASVMRLARRLAEGQCAMCGACTQACPKGLPVADLVRCSDYYMARSEHFVSAQDTYAELAGSMKSACDDCGACERVCARHVPVRHHVHRATRVLA